MVAAGMIASHVKGRRMVNVRPTVRGGRRVVRRRHPRLVVRNAREIKDFFEDEVNFSNPFGEWGINLENTYKEAWKNFRLKTALPLPTGSHPDGSEFRWTPQVREGRRGGGETKGGDERVPDIFFLILFREPQRSPNGLSMRIY